MTTPTETKQEITDREKSEAILEKAESLVLHPATHNKVVSVGGKTLTLRPLPITTAKKLNAYAKNAYEKINEFQGKSPSATEDDATGLLESLSHALEQTCVDLVEFYSAQDALLPVEDKLSIQEILFFIDSQVEVNGDNDFLLSGLKTVSKIIQTAGKAQTHQLASVISSQMSTDTSAEHGESLSKSSPKRQRRVK
jgi:hypothetical protein